MTGIKFDLDNFFRTDLICSEISLDHNRVPSNLENLEILTAMKTNRKKIRENINKRLYNKSDKVRVVFLVR